MTSGVPGETYRPMSIRRIPTPGKGRDDQLLRDDVLVRSTAAAAWSRAASAVSRLACVELPPPTSARWRRR